MKSLPIAFIFLLLVSSAFAHNTDYDTYVRVVSADPESREYSFRCVPDEYNGYDVDWDVYADDSNQEFFFSDIAGDEDFSFTFPDNLYWHIGCLVVEPSTGTLQWRGDLHIDLRDELPRAEVIPLSVDGLTVEMHCWYDSDNPYTVSWAVTRYWGAPHEPTRRYDLNSTSKIFNYTAQEHGIDHPRCVIRDQVTNEQFEVGLPIEQFEDAVHENNRLYMADWYGIDVNNSFAPFDYDTWIARFSNYPPNGTEEEEEPGEEICYSSVNDMPATCSAGAFTTDNQGGCRTLVCAGKQVLACNKGGFFEMYNQGGPGGVSICLGETCISNNGYVRSPAYPICLEVENPTVCGDSVVEGDEMCDDGNEENGDGCNAVCEIEPEPSVMAAVVQAYDHNYVFSCVPSLFSPTSFTWEFGDGDVETYVDEVNQPGFVFHSYEANGPFVVTCNATDGAAWAAHSVAIDVDSANRAPPVYSTELMVTNKGGNVWELVANAIGASGWTMMEWWSIDIDTTPYSGLLQFASGDNVTVDVQESVNGLIGEYLAPGVYTLRFDGGGVAESEYWHFYDEAYVPCNAIHGCVQSLDNLVNITLVTPPICGDNVTDDGEQCDDENNISGDGCSMTCEIEVPDPICGNGLLEAGEMCDDGNDMNDDGCSAVCEIEAPEQACYSAVSDMPATCSAGAFSTDNPGGCRTLVCAGKQVLACDKGGFFEMYNQGGPSNVEICLGEHCMTNQGFIRSDNYPICFGPPPVCTDVDFDTYYAQGGVCGALDCADSNSAVNPGATEVCNGIDDNCNGIADEGGVCSVCGNSVVEEGESCDDGNLLNDDGCSMTCSIESDGGVTLSIAPWFPQGNNVVLVCSAEGFEPTSYSWVYGDGGSWLNSNRADVWHTYPRSGSFAASCTASNGVTTETGELNVLI